MRKKVGWIWIIGAILLFISNFFTLANQYVVIAKWADITSGIIALFVCPVLILIGVAILILGKKDND
jgi:uncharacterized membrane protein